MIKNYHLLVPTKRSHIVKETLQACEKLQFAKLLFKEIAVLNSRHFFTTFAMMQFY